ncbi:uncharacterized protein SPPG_03616 [Spizellomyces punctatus DAOM BR117]|uniref:Uncharacterized protein n=1 Tax=Spizellomyces punctatus (strain DAOM BR117) TaxID=645134 RepID=A0A0L0HK36_SPIPD|nr:uncharacterized protein SPPG_03616 [Spizellomyces punctatus DAOM BR117]KND01826.1 hypothetical protein SPPG_03616 [Spizellomyces punctatus DAOM BR117]|eukprot:XP_016609865.1 hypothetical protein SPPG_03616 [Spizellomyces punctatus DAOM BR117]
MNGPNSKYATPMAPCWNGSTALVPSSPFKSNNQEHMFNGKLWLPKGRGPCLTPSDANKSVIQHTKESLKIKGRAFVSLPSFCLNIPTYKLATFLLFCTMAEIHGQEPHTYEYASADQLAERDMDETQKARFEELMHKPAHELRNILEEHHIEYKDCNEKQEFARKIMDRVKD